MLFLMRGRRGSGLRIRRFEDVGMMGGQATREGCDSFRLLSVLFLMVPWRWGYDSVGLRMCMCLLDRINARTRLVGGLHIG